MTAANSKTAHTPGPWRYDDMAMRLVRGRGATVCELVPQEAAEANGRLIAQAPAMLDVLREIVAANAERPMTVAEQAYCFQHALANAQTILAAIEVTP